MEFLPSADHHTLTVRCPPLDARAARQQSDRIQTEELMMSTFQFVAIFCMLLAIFIGEGWA
jgi:hypothetical protein